MQTPQYSLIYFSPEEYDFEKLDIALPALLLDLENAKLNPLPTEFKHEGHSIYSNLGELELYANMRAVVLVNNRSSIPITDTLSIDPQAGARHLAFQVAGFVNAADRFGEPCGMSQVSHIEPIPITAQRTTTLIAWHVRWQHSNQYRGQGHLAGHDPTCERKRYKARNGRFQSSRRKPC